MTVYGYARVSSKGQERDGNGLEVQERQLKEAGCSEIVSEAFTGTKMERPKLSALIERLQPGDTFMVAKLDRIARTSLGGCELVRDLMERGVTVRVLNMGTIEDTPMGRMMLTVMFAMAEFDRDMIVQRLAEGMEVARANNPDFKVGRKPVSVDEHQFRDLTKKVESGQITNQQAWEELGIGKTTWYKLRKAA
ncbi:recombinase family protein [Olsenella sp. HMSC062G07]|uniref:recombinase family protein n=1 Tax=Olsenella sp. HMSC062G07 TaxID=1739330 RepID=UPI0008A49805|nr:recombinase family protein [Olsenella sp. HMSC062G07]OFK23309.1 hypothetical protein HMPREF2826_05190 [Olsenella sp. HMSC062G07]